MPDFLKGLYPHVRAFKITQNPFAVRIINDENLKLAALFSATAFILYKQ
jgi:hypothetical protein